MLKYKPGYRTSEFWFTLVSFIFSGLYLLGIINDNSQKEELISNISHGVESCILIGGQLAILWKYINSRKEVKKSWWSTIQNPIENVENKDGSNDQRPDIKPESNSSKTRTRKNNTTNKRKSKSSKKNSSK